MIAAALDARLDHVATAVPDVAAALAHWCGVVGAGLVVRERNDSFHSAQVRFAGGGKLELLAPPPGAGPDAFVRRFLDKHGPVPHHVTLKVDDLGEAIDTVRAGGYDVVDIQLTDPHWREGFLRPSQVGGFIVQVAWAAEDDAALAARLGTTPTEPADGVPRLLGPTLAHPDLASARALWALLGADVTVGRDRLVCRWPDSSLDVEVVAGERAGPVAVRFGGPVREPGADGPPVPPITVVG
jgi:catechol 2,3-dioxygenase-like lactoylglutathione lyase family enzyme